MNGRRCEKDMPTVTILNSTRASVCFKNFAVVKFTCERLLHGIKQLCQLTQDLSQWKVIPSSVKAI